MLEWFLNIIEKLGGDNNNGRKNFKLIASRVSGN